MPTTPVKRNIVEVHPDGSKAFELSLPTNVIAYRVSKQPWRELVQKILVSNTEVLEGNTYSFNKDGKITGVSMKYIQLSGDSYNSVTVTRVPYGPVKPQFVADAPIIYPVSILYGGAAISSHTSEIHIDVHAYPEIKQPASASLFMREFPGQGLFMEMPTSYDSTSHELIARTTIFGEIVCGQPDVPQGLPAPILIEPLDKKRVLANTPLLLKWSGRGLLQSFTAQMAEDSLFHTIVLDSTTTNSFIQRDSLSKAQKYYWRVRANGTNAPSDWSGMWSFVPEDAFLQVVSPNGGEVLARGDTSIIRWETNVADSVRLEILQGGVNLGFIGKTLANVNALRWIVPTSLLPSPLCRIRIVSIQDTTLSDTSDTVFSLIDPAAVNNTNRTVPMDFNLAQNYPNPFNPSTKISYSVPERSWITVKIFNALGEEVVTLVNEERPAGTYELNWNAANSPSGVYFYRIQAGKFVATKRMILLK
jgi:hypothetical protein